MKENNWESENKELFQQIESLRNEVEKIKNNAIPVGAIQAFALKKAPEGWLICNGRALNVEANQKLFNVIGNVFGGDGIKTFCLPDLRGQFVRGWDMEGNIDSERELGSFQGDALQGHRHDYEVNKLNLNIENAGKHYHPLWCDMCNTTVGGWGGSEYQRMAYPDSSGGNGKTDLSPISGEHSHKATLTCTNNPVGEVASSKWGQSKIDIETRPKNIALLYCIKY